MNTRNDILEEAARACETSYRTPDGWGITEADARCAELVRSMKGVDQSAHNVVLQVSEHSRFDTAGKRKMFVDCVSSIINVRSMWSRRFEPYTLNDSDYEWSVHEGNDWWVFFDEEDNTKVRIQHRYATFEALDPVSRWVAYLWRAQII